MLASMLLGDSPSEGARAAAVLIPTAVLLPTVLLSSRTLFLLALILLLGVVLFSLLQLGVDTAFWAHIFPGMILIRGAWSVLSGDGSPVLLRLTQAVVGVILSLAMFIGALRIMNGTLYSMVHTLWWVATLVLTLGFFVHRVAVERYPASAHLIKEARTVAEPASYAGIGVMLYTHLHDTQPLGMFFHQGLGCMLVTLAATQVLTTYVHSVRAVDSGAALLTRSLQAFVWLLAGAWAIEMAAFVFMFPGKRGLHHFIWTKMPMASEEGGTLLGLDLLLAGVCLAVMRIRLLRSGGEEVAPVLEGVSVDGVHGHKHALLSTREDAHDATEE